MCFFGKSPNSACAGGDLIWLAVIGFVYVARKLGCLGPVTYVDCQDQLSIASPPEYLSLGTWIA